MITATCPTCVTPNSNTPNINTKTFVNDSETVSEPKPTHDGQFNSNATREQKRQKVLAHETSLESQAAPAVLNNHQRADRPQWFPIRRVMSVLRAEGKSRCADESAYFADDSETPSSPSPSLSRDFDDSSAQCEHHTLRTSRASMVPFRGGLSLQQVCGVSTSTLFGDKSHEVIIVRNCQSVDSYFRRDFEHGCCQGSQS